MKAPFKRFIQYWTPPLTLCIGIFIESSSRIPDIGPDIPHIDKGVHFILFGVLAVFFHRAFGTLAVFDGRSRLRIWAAILTAVLYGLSDEFHQYFVPYRTADLADALADAVGAITMTLGYQYVMFTWMRYKPVRRGLLQSRQGADPLVP
jgi:hypothetical protein